MFPRFARPTIGRVPAGKSSGPPFSPLRGGPILRSPRQRSHASLYGQSGTRAMPARRSGRLFFLSQPACCARQKQRTDGARAGARLRCACLAELPLLGSVLSGIRGGGAGLFSFAVLILTPAHILTAGRENGSVYTPRAPPIHGENSRSSHSKGSWPVRANERQEGAVASPRSFARSAARALKCSLRRIPQRSP